MSDQVSPWLTCPEAAARARCGPRTVQRAIKAGELRANRVGNRLLMLSEWVDAWVSSQSAYEVADTTKLRKVAG